MGFNFKKWYSENGLKQSTVEALEKNDLDSEDALQLVQADDVATPDLTLGLRKLFMQALKLLSGTDPVQKPEEKHSSESTPPYYQVTSQRWRPGRPAEKDRRNLHG